MKGLFAAAVAPQGLLVCHECEIKSIAEALAQAQPGAEITVRGGVYDETPIVVDKAVSLKGEQSPTLDGRHGNHHILVIKADGVSVSGFTLKNTGVSYTEELAGVRVIGAKNCRIEGNNFLDTTFGTYLEKSDSCRIAGNTFLATNKSDSAAGNGIHIWNGSNHVIERNLIQGHRDGIYFEFVKGTKIRDNVSRGNLRYGLHFMSSNDNDYVNNTFLSNGSGVAVMYANNIVMQGNKFIKNRGSATFGLLLKDITASRIEDNTFDDNSVGIYMEGTSRSSFKNNRIRSNGWALRIMGNCDGNEFTRNSFINNSFDAATNSEMNLNDFHENYWSRYDGYDLDHDGIGDVPYRPVSLSSLILERADSSFILLNSFLFSLLDEIERALPALIPERLKDEKPLMRKPDTIQPLRREERLSDRD